MQNALCKMANGFTGSFDPRERVGHDSCFSIKEPWRVEMEGLLTAELIQMEGKIGFPRGHFQFEAKTGPGFEMLQTVSSDACPEHMLAVFCLFDFLSRDLQPRLSWNS